VPFRRHPLFNETSLGPMENVRRLPTSWGSVAKSTHSRVSGSVSLGISIDKSASRKQSPPMRSQLAITGQCTHPLWFETAHSVRRGSVPKDGRFCRKSGQDNVILGNSFVPSYFRPVRNIPYMGCSNFLATAMSACRRAFFRASRLSKRAFAWESQRDATSAGM
jgi:hypothetical protein